MQEIDTSVWGLDDTISSDEQLTALREITQRIADEQRARLGATRPEYVWWADVVFFFRDTRFICSILRATGNESISDMVAGVFGVTMGTLLLHLMSDDVEKFDQLHKELMQEVDLINAIMGQALSKWRGG